MMNKVFISHPYSDNPKLRLKQVDCICKNLPPDILPISPLHLFSFEDDDSRREEILQVCFNLIDMCEKVFIYNYGKLSRGQKKEKKWVENLNAGLYPCDIDLQIKEPPERCIQMGAKQYAIESQPAKLEEGWI